ncbi:hypothetical protein PGT21_017055 [Puccinia graminis f. sp. tritici]|uniref:Uncharacterized protein n=1 Tax=Puccinia graminis f. sp. tritici TaxID=56615 RepID=A0A5B0M6P3_PUCGR|nr:hypothetical protein PGT21_017055 [Puccinia graminis f. sp. tritici]KAA1125952.1 hypothetical protein PGTUg99_024306 [Puccinia graminis f. sp. tritici]
MWVNDEIHGENFLHDENLQSPPNKNSIEIPSWDSFLKICRQEKTKNCLEASSSSNNQKKLQIDDEVTENLHHAQISKGKSICLDKGGLLETREIIEGIPHEVLMSSNKQIGSEKRGFETANVCENENVEKLSTLDPMIYSAKRNPSLDKAQNEDISFESNLIEVPLIENNLTMNTENTENTPSIPFKDLEVLKLKFGDNENSGRKYANLSQKQSIHKEIAS